MIDGPDGPPIHLACVLESPICQNPLDVPEDKPAVPPRCRLDRTLVDKLAMGEGCGGPGGPRVHHPSQHIKSWEMLQPLSKRPKHLDPQDLMESILLRLWQLQQVYFAKVRHPSLSSDGVRITTKDVNYLCLAGDDGQDKPRAGWGVMVIPPSQ